MTPNQADLSRLETEWDTLARRDRVPPFARPGWVRAWAAAFDKTVEVLTARDGDGLAGVLPVIRRRSALCAPSNRETPAFTPVADTPQAARSLVDMLFTRRPSRIDLWPVDRENQVVGLLRSAADSNGYSVSMRPVAFSPYVDTDGDWGNYVAGLPAKHRRETRRRHRRLHETGVVTLDVHADAGEYQHLLTLAFEIEATGWKAAHGTAISSRARTDRFYRNVADWAARHGMLRLIFLSLDGKAIAFDLSLESNGVHYLLKTGYDAAYKSFAPGTLLHYEALRRAFDSDIVRYEFMGTSLGTRNAWKRQWTSQEHELVRMQAFSPTIRGFVSRSWSTRILPARDAVITAAARAVDMSLRRKMHRFLARFRRFRY